LRDWRINQMFHPVPIIQPSRCNGCRLCEMVCPTPAIQRLFEIVALDSLTDEQQ
jgi:formate hydrogenlyase subunit 6/NADH:ubiquinone oxidoreductase subunit I